MGDLGKNNPQDKKLKTQQKQPFMKALPKHAPSNENKLPVALLLFRIVIVILIIGIVAWWFMLR